MRPRLQRAVLWGGLTWLAGLLALAPPTELRRYTDALRATSAQLTGRWPYVDVATTVLGARAMREGRPVYVPLTEAFRREGIAWDLPFASTHPPTTFLWMVPFAGWSLTTAIAIWSWLMLAALCWSVSLLGCPPKVAIGIGCLALLWPPVMLSLGQLTVLWLLGVCLALRTSGAARGASIALASMTKLTPALLLLPVLAQRQWRDVAGFAAAWAVALLLVTWYSGSLIGDYLATLRSSALLVAQRPDNAAPMAVAGRLLGAAGPVVILVIAAWMLVAATRRPLPDQVLLASYVSVLLLPIAWIYSACALVPAWWAFLTAGHSWRAWTTGASVGILAVGPSFGSAASIPIAVAILLPCIGFLVDAHRSDLVLIPEVTA